ncbi:jg2250 [Pararge aegeria aegeria]|uniref:Jg2250 protein n=1 Tax=Pararge aegeria aegeria TaxID=348720 RepID=A0A8S4SNQ8_9NEOP|nr:jg2250 [Pararge aegeria aegeria]
MRIVEDPSCSECGEVETSFHFTAKCPMYVLVRWALQGANLSIGDIVRFTKGNGRFEGGMLPEHQHLNHGA